MSVLDVITIFLCGVMSTLYYEVHPWKEVMKMKTTEILHGFWAGTHTASPEVRRSWQQISKTIEASVPEEQRKVLLQMMA